MSEVLIGGALLALYMEMPWPLCVMVLTMTRGLWKGRTEWR